MEHRSFFQTIYRTFLLTVITITALSCLILSYGSYRDYRINSEQVYEQALTSQKNLLQSNIQNMVSLAAAKMLNIEDKTKEAIFYRSQEAIDIAYEIYANENLSSSPQTVKRLIRETLRGIRYNRGTGYYFIADLNNDHLILYPPDPKIEGRPIAELGADWAATHQHFSSLMATFGDGFHRYQWPKPQAPETLYKKITFVKAFAPYNWYIGTGLYINDYQLIVQNEIIKDVEAFHIHDNNLVLFDEQHHVLVGEGAAKSDITIFKPGAFKQVGDVLYYAQTIAGLSWTIGSKGDLAPIKQRIAGDLQQLKQVAILQLSVIIAMALGVGSLLFWLLKRINHGVQGSFNLFIDTFQLSAQTNQTIPAESIGFVELLELSETANAMIAENKRIKDGLNDYKTRLEELVEERTSDLKLAQDRLLVQERMAVLGQLTATVSHELRNPLGTLRNALHNLQAALKINNPKLVQRSLSISERNIERCDRIINELLDFSRDTDPDLQPIPIDGFLADCLAELHWPDDIQLSRTLKSGAVVDADIDLLQRVVVNVCVNAQQALLETSHTDKRVDIMTHTKGSILEIVVQDNGPGIPEEIRDKIFEPLFSTKSFGIGLGMSIVKNIMEKHHGGVRIENQAQPGCRLVLWLPVSHKP